MVVQFRGDLYDDDGDGDDDGDNDDDNNDDGDNDNDDRLHVLEAMVVQFRGRPKHCCM
jgi:hypothetical protein